MRADADHFNASIGSVAPDCFEHQEELLRKHGATSLVVDLRNIHPRRVRRYSNRNRLKEGVPGDPANCRHGANLECGRMPALSGLLTIRWVRDPAHIPLRSSTTL